MDKKETVNIDMEQHGTVFALIAMFLVFAVMTGGKNMPSANISNLVMQNGYVVILAVSMLLCMLTGNIDLGVGSTVALCGAIVGILMIDCHTNMWVAILAVLAIGILAGIFVGLFVSRLSIPSLIVTLATMFMGCGLTYTLLKAQTRGPLSTSYTYIGAGFLPTTKIPFRNGTLDVVSIIAAGTVTVLVIMAELKSINAKKKHGFPINPSWQIIIKEAVILMIVWLFFYKLSRYNGIPFVPVVMGVLAGPYHFITSKTAAGRQTYALGSNAKAAKLFGISTEKVFFWVCTNVGISSAIAGIVLSVHNASTTPKVGNGFEMDATTSRHIGGATISGGIGTTIGAVVSALIMGILNNGMFLYGWSTDIQKIVEGAVLLGTVTVDLLPKRKKGRVLITGIQELKYKEVYNRVLDNISSGALGVGEKLPSEDELSERFGPSRQTVRHAMDTLEQQKLALRVRGSGTCVGGSGKMERQERYMNIAVISAHVDSYTFPPMVRGTERVLSKGGYTTQTAFTGNRVGREQDTLNNLIDKDIIDGLIVEPAKSALHNPNLHYHQKPKERGIPILFFSSRYPELELPCVSMNDEQVGKKAVEYLIKNSCQNIGGVFKSDGGQGHLRHKGFLSGMLEAGIKVKDASVVWLDTEDLLDLDQRSGHPFHKLEGCTGVMRYNDEVAYVLSDLCEKRGTVIPDQLSIVSVDNSDLATLASIKPTSFPYPIEVLGRRAAENMISMIENPYFDGNYLFNSDIIERDFVKVLGRPRREGMRWVRERR